MPNHAKASYLMPDAAIHHSSRAHHRRARPGRLRPGRHCPPRGASAGAGHRGDHDPGHHAVRDTGATAARCQLLCLPRREGHGRLARGLARRAIARRRDRSGNRARRSREERAAEGGATRRWFSPHATRARQVAGRRHRRPRAMDSRRRDVAVDRRGANCGDRVRAPDHRRAPCVLGVPANHQHEGAGRATHRVAAHRHRPLHSRATRTRRPRPGGRGQQADADSPRHH